MKERSIKMPELEWRTISYTEDDDTEDGHVASVEIIVERPYKNGYLVQCIWENYDTGQICRNMTFVEEA